MPRCLPEEEYPNKFSKLDPNLLFTRWYGTQPTQHIGRERIRDRMFILRKVIEDKRPAWMLEEQQTYQAPQYESKTLEKAEVDHAGKLKRDFWHMKKKSVFVTDKKVELPPEEPVDVSSLMELAEKYHFLQNKTEEFLPKERPVPGQLQKQFWNK